MKRILSVTALLLSPLIAGCGITPVNQSGNVASSLSSVSMNVQDPERGAEMSLGMGELSGANGMLANGAMTAQYFGTNGTIISLRLNIAAAGPGMTYVAWLTTADNVVLKLGTLENEGDDVRHSLRFETDSDLRKAPKLMVTLEQNQTDSPTGETVAMGIFKEIRR